MEIPATESGEVPSSQAAASHSRREKSSLSVIVPDQEGVKIDEAVVIEIPREKLFETVRNLRGIVRFVPSLAEITVVNDFCSRWLICGAIGKPVEWNVEIFHERPGELIAWRTFEPSDVNTAGSVWFRDLSGGKGTEVRVLLKYDIPNEFVKTLLMKLFGHSPEQEVRESLRRFKAYMETGEIPTAAGQPRGPVKGQVP